jgi:hypothetical protein
MCGRFDLVPPKNPLQEFCKSSAPTTTVQYFSSGHQNSLIET